MLVQRLLQVLQNLQEQVLRLQLVLQNSEWVLRLQPQLLQNLLRLVQH